MSRLLAKAQSAAEQIRHEQERNIAAAKAQETHRVLRLEALKNLVMGEISQLDKAVTQRGTLEVLTCSSAGIGSVFCKVLCHEPPEEGEDGIYHEIILLRSEIAPNKHKYDDESDAVTTLDPTVIANVHGKSLAVELSTSDHPRDTELFFERLGQSLSFLF